LPTNISLDKPFAVQVDKDKIAYVRYVEEKDLSEDLLFCKRVLLQTTAGHLFFTHKGVHSFNLKGVMAVCTSCNKFN